MDHGLHSLHQGHQKYPGVGHDHQQNQQSSEGKHTQQVEGTLHASLDQSKDSKELADAQDWKQQAGPDYRVVNCGMKDQQGKGRQERQRGNNRQDRTPIKKPFPLPPVHKESLAMKQRGVGHGLLRLIHRCTAHDGTQNLGAQEQLRTDRSDVAIEDDEVGQHAGSDQAFLFLRELGES